MSLFSGENQSLQDILEARDKRVEYQEYLLKEFKNTIVSYKLNIPGPIKYNSIIKDIFDEGLKTFKHNLDAAAIIYKHEQTLYKNSGPEYFAVLYESEYAVKRLTTTIEETHLLGRLFDFDVLDVNGKQISRKELGYEPRKCLLCGNNAFECGRSRKHNINDLLKEIEKLAQSASLKG